MNKININTTEGIKVSETIKDINKVIDIKKRIITYFQELDLYKEGKKNKLTASEVEKIEKIGFTKYCDNLIDKFCKYVQDYDIAVLYITQDLKIEIPDKELIEGIQIEKYINYSI